MWQRALGGAVVSSATQHCDEVLVPVCQFYRGRP
ncbi:MAG TPA: hypothetical protein EYG11_05095 [Candidatus Latescibacteria bacterium]|nr:hypothetical protein [Candidatus Latescibacterota bacterium]